MSIWKSHPEVTYRLIETKALFDYMSDVQTVAWDRDTQSFMINTDDSVILLKDSLVVGRVYHLNIQVELVIRWQAEWSTDNQCWRVTQAPFTKNRVLAVSGADRR